MYRVKLTKFFMILGGLTLVILFMFFIQCKYFLRLNKNERYVYMENTVKVTIKAIITYHLILDIGVTHI